MPRESGRPYRAYLLRCWQEEGTPSCPAPRWRFFVEDILQRRSRRGFERLEALVAFLQADLAGGGSDPEDKDWSGETPSIR